MTNRSLLAFPALALVALLVFAACGGEDRPGVTVIAPPGGGSVSVSGPGPGEGPTSGTALYKPVSDVEGQLDLAEDVRDISALIAVARDGRPIDWSAATALYEKGKNSKRPDGSLRSLAATAADDDVLAQFPNGEKVFGTKDFLDANVRAGLAGSGRGKGLSDEARGELVKKGSLVILYGAVLDELQDARIKIVNGNTGPTVGAPHNVDEAWAFYAGAADDKSARPYALAAVALAREANFNAKGKLDGEIQEELQEAQEKAAKGDLAGFDKEVAEVRQRLNAVFYLSTLQEFNEALEDTQTAPRQKHLAEAWAYWQALRPIVAGVSSSRAGAVEAVFARDGSQPVTKADVDQVYGALNSEDVLKALGVSRELAIQPPR